MQIKDFPSTFKQIYVIESGSRAYGAELPNSDFDIRGIFIPQKKYLYPEGIAGYDNFPTVNNFRTAYTDENVYDVELFNIARFFKLAEEGSVNLIDDLYVDLKHILYMNDFGYRIRQNREMFISINYVAKCQAWSYGQYNDAVKKKDWKAAYHAIRLLNQAECVLTYNSILLDLATEEYRRIRTGYYTWKQFEGMYRTQENRVEDLRFTKKNFRKEVDKQQVRNLLEEILKEQTWNW